MTEGEETEDGEGEGGSQGGEVIVRGKNGRGGKRKERKGKGKV